VLIFVVWGLNCYFHVYQVLFMNKKHFIWAHRGASGLAPENTMSAFVLAEKLGADGIELDVHLSRDGVPIVIHDETVDRTTDSHGAISELSLLSLKELDVGSWFSTEFSGEALPTLADVLGWIENRLRLNIEIKSTQAGQAVLDLLSDYPQAKVLVSSFRHSLLFSLRELAPDLPIGFLSDSRFWRVAVKRATACRAESFHPPAKYVSRLMVNACHRSGLTVYPWTVDDVSRRNTLLRMGVDGFFTNLP
jgi:glycerophosphoryl diester phosphodiesterase